MAVQREQVVQTAEKYVSRGKIEPAIREYRKLLADNPNDINTLNRIGDLYARIQRIDEAVDFFTQIAEQYSTEGFFVKAIAIYKKIIKLDPTRLEVYEKLAELYHQQGLVNEARTQYQVLADYYQKHDNAASAIAIYQKMADLEPNNPSYHVKLAEIYQPQQLIEKAMGEYRIIAEMMIAHGRAQDAAQVYERALDIDSSNLGVHQRRRPASSRTSGNAAAAARFLADRRRAQSAGGAHRRASPGWTEPARARAGAPTPRRGPAAAPRPRRPGSRAAALPAAASLPRRRSRSEEFDVPIYGGAVRRRSRSGRRTRTPGGRGRRGGRPRGHRCGPPSRPSAPEPAEPPSRGPPLPPPSRRSRGARDRAGPRRGLRPRHGRATTSRRAWSSRRRTCGWRRQPPRLGLERRRQWPEDEAPSARDGARPSELGGSWRRSPRSSSGRERSFDLATASWRSKSSSTSSRSRRGAARRSLDAGLRRQPQDGEFVLELESTELPPPRSSLGGRAGAAGRRRSRGRSADRRRPAGADGRGAAAARTLARDEDLVSEAEVLAKYGLEEKALERLREALRHPPQNLGRLRRDDPDPPGEGAPRARGRAGQHHVAAPPPRPATRSVWPKTRRQLVEAGYRLDGDRVLAGPHGHGRGAAAPPAPGRCRLPAPPQAAPASSRQRSAGSGAPCRRRRKSVQPWATASTRCCAAPAGRASRAARPVASRLPRRRLGPGRRLRLAAPPAPGAPAAAGSVSAPPPPRSRLRRPAAAPGRCSTRWRSAR